MSDLSEAIRRARRGVANNNALAVVSALEPHREHVTSGDDLRSTLDLAWAFGELGRSAEADRLLAQTTRATMDARLCVSLARAGWF